MFINLEGLVDIKDNSFSKERVSNGILKANIYENKVLLQEKMKEISNYTESNNIQVHFKNSLSFFENSTFFDEYDLSDRLDSVYNDSICYKGDYVESKLEQYDEVSSLYDLYDLDKNILGEEFEDFVLNVESEIESIDFNKNIREGRLFKIVLAGQFSAGKSTFINTLLQNDLLPNDITETSSIATFVNFDNKVSNVNVKGVNRNNAFAPIDIQLLEYLKHGTQANEMLAQVIDKLIVSVPNSFENNFVLVDTPGHNKSDVKNTFNNKRDYDVALGMTMGADVVFYLVDISKGGLQESDYEFLKKIDNSTEVYIIFTKAMHKPFADVKKIVDETVSNLFGQSKFSNQSLGGNCNIKKVFAYDSLEKEMVYVPLEFNRGVKSTINAFINEVLKESCQVEEDSWAKINKLFEDMYDFYLDSIIEEEEEYKYILGEELLLKKNAAEVDKMLTILDNYKGVAYVKQLLDKAYVDLIKKRDNCVFNIQYFKVINDLLDNCHDALSIVFKAESNAYYNLPQNIEKSKKEEILNRNIYNIIEDNDLESFLFYLSTEGIRVLDYNSQNFSAMTYTVKNGNLDMVKVFLQNNIDITLLDKRGYNMFHTAIEYGNISIIEVLLKYDSNVLHSKTCNGEGYKELIGKQLYYNRIENLVAKYGA